jgi:hypothetical protein
MTLRNALVRASAIAVLAVAAAGIGYLIYDAGVAVGLAEAAGHAGASGDSGTGSTGAPHFGWGWGAGYGFGFIGILVWILGIWLIAGILRSLLGSSRSDGAGDLAVSRERLEELHRQLHDRDGHAS